ncbi:hypothetical protein GTO91_16490, partial [Heliobacterium undosum]
NKYVTRYKDKIKFGITNIGLGKDRLIVHFYIDNQSDKDVKVAVFKNMSFIDGTRKQYEAIAFESDDFTNISPGAYKEGKVAFNYSTALIKGNYSFESNFWIMDPTAGNTHFSIPIVVD